MLKKIYEELVLIRKELQAIRSSKEFKSEQEFILDRVPYERSYRMIPKQHYKGQ